MGRLSPLAARLNDAMNRQIAHRESARDDLMAELEALGREAEVFQVRTSKKTGLTLGFRGKKLQITPTPDPTRIALAYEGGDEDEALVFDDSAWSWTHGSGRPLAEGGLEELLHMTLDVPVEVPEPEEPLAPHPSSPRAKPAPPVKPTPRPQAIKPPSYADADNITWILADRVRVDMLCYSGRNCSGRQQVVRVFPGQHRKGTLDGFNFQSVLIGGSVGVRVVFATGFGEEWWKSPWRAVVLTEENTFVAQNGKHAVRIPDLDIHQAPDARYAPDGVGESYPLAERLDPVIAWSYGGVGSHQLKNRVRTIFVDRV